MTLRTGIRWIDSELQGRQTTYIRCDNPRLRTGILQRSIATNINDQEITLLSFSEPRNGYWSFDLEATLAASADQHPMDELQERISLHRIGQHATPSRESWDDIIRQDSSLVIADQVTNLKIDSLHGNVTPLERAADRLHRISDHASLLILDSNPPYRPLTDHIDTTIEIQRQGDLMKALISHSGREKSLERTIGLNTSQKTLEEFSQALATSPAASTSSTLKSFSYTLMLKYLVNVVNGTVAGGIPDVIDDWIGTDLISTVESVYEGPIVAENDANAAALGEYYFGT
ncbi:MAG: hypothetical protein SVU32_09570, partial [Candidatus Nanohaloarchaea archaeon]|nr:hypothetical protein [Candidatus Nanohaloarchaea archaeon]